MQTHGASMSHRASYIRNMYLETSPKLHLRLPVPHLRFIMLHYHSASRRSGSAVLRMGAFERFKPCIIWTRPAQATLAPNVVSGLEAVARDFLGKTLELGCAAARRRRSEVLAPSDLAVGLERMWCVATVCATGCCTFNLGAAFFYVLAFVVAAVDCDVMT
jgi:Transcription initiation factor TFIID subunit A